MLGLPPDINQRLLEWSDSIAVCLGNPLRTFEQALEAQRAMISLTEYLRDIVAERRRRPGSDFISLLIGITEDGAVHFCIGNQLARLEAQIALSRLLTQFPHMKLIDAVPQWSPNLAFRSLRTLHLDL